MRKIRWGSREVGKEGAYADDEEEAREAVEEGAREATEGAEVKARPWPNEPSRKDMDKTRDNTNPVSELVQALLKGGQGVQRTTW